MNNLRSKNVLHARCVHFSVIFFVLMSSCLGARSASFALSDQAIAAHALHFKHQARNLLVAKTSGVTAGGALALYGVYLFFSDMRTARAYDLSQHRDFVRELYAERNGVVKKAGWHSYISSIVKYGAIEGISSVLSTVAFSGLGALVGWYRDHQKAFVYTAAKLSQDLSFYTKSIHKNIEYALGEQKDLSCELCDLAMYTFMVDSDVLMCKDRCERMLGFISYKKQTCSKNTALISRCELLERQVRLLYEAFSASYQKLCWSDAGTVQTFKAASDKIQQEFALVSERVLALMGVVPQTKNTLFSFSGDE